MDRFNVQSGQRVTSWTYDSQRGWLSTKRYPDANGNPGSVGEDYSYYFSGILSSRTWAREASPGVGLTTIYHLNVYRDIFQITYNDNGATPAVYLGRDRLGRLGSVSRNNITTTLSYNGANQLLSESYSGGTLNGLSVTAGYDNYLRRNYFDTRKGSALTHHSFDYDSNSGWLQTVSDGAGNQAAYSYVANSPLVDHIDFKQNNTSRMTTTS
jgi:hypothetical protein